MLYLAGERAIRCPTPRRSIAVGSWRGIIPGTQPLHHLRPIVLHVADLGRHFPPVDLAGIGLYHRRGLVRRAAHPIVELNVIKYDRHTGDTAGRGTFSPRSTP